MATNLEAFPVDPALPQLAIASDPARMCAVFRQYLRPLAGRAYDIQDCVLWRLRYRRAQRCILQYKLRLVEPRTGREQSQWVTGVIDAEAPSRDEGRGMRDENGAGLSSSLIPLPSSLPSPGEQIPEAFMTFEPDAFIADLGMLVQVYPQDRRLPALPLLLGGPPPNLERLLLAELGPGDWQAVAWQVEPGRYRAGLAAVLRYELEAREAATGRREGRRFYLKVYRDGDAGQRTFDTQKMLWEIADAVRRMCTANGRQRKAESAGSAVHRGDPACSNVSPAGVDLKRRVGYRQRG